MDPIVTIIMPTYNQGKYVGQAIESVLCQQFSRKYTLLICDDCSTDNTYQICQEYRKKYPDKILLNSNKKNLGIIKNYQKIFSLVKTKYVAILEGDDIWHNPHKLELQINVLEENEHIGIVYSDHNIINFDGSSEIALYEKYSRPIPIGNIFNYLLISNPITAVTACFRYQLVINNVDFNEFIENSFVTVDYPLWIELSQNTEAYFIDESLATYRFHEESISNSGKFEQKESFILGLKEISCFFARKYEKEKILKQITQICFKRLLLLSVKNNKRESILKYRGKLRIDSINNFVLIVVSFFPRAFKLFYSLRVPTKTR